MSKKDNPWYQLGFALEMARGRGGRKKEPEGLEALKERFASIRAGLEDRTPSRKDLKKKGRSLARRVGLDGKGGQDSASTDALVLTAATAVTAELLKRIPGGSRIRLLDYLRAGASGAAAALAVEVLAPLLAGKDRVDRDEIMRRVLAGVGEGLVYAAALEPRLPGSPAVKGAITGAASWILAPLGGITRLLRPLSPHRKIPVMSDLLEAESPEDRDFIEAVALGVLLGVLYGSADSSGIDQES